VSCAKMAELIKMQFRILSPVVNGDVGAPTERGTFGVSGRL